MSKKKIDELFQETFLGHYEVPDKRVWDSIAASLDKKKKKRILPLWWSLSGIAAALVLGFVLFNPFTSQNTIEPTITDVEQQDTKTDTNDITPTIQQPRNTQVENDTQIANEEDESPILKENDTQIANTKTDRKPNLDTDRNKNTNQSTNTKDNWVGQENAVAQNPNEGIKGNSKSTNKGNANSANNSVPSNTQITETATASGNKNKKQGDLDKTDVLENTLNKTKETKVAAANTSKPKEIDAKDNLKNTNTTETLVGEDKNTKVADNQTKSQQTDSIPHNKKSIFDEINIQQEEQTGVTEHSAKRWSAGPSVAPVYFNAIGEGSPVHSIFVPNAKSGNVNMSYGLSVGYEINSKLKIRSGVHRVDLGYDTNEISFSSSPVASTNGQIDNIDYTLTARNLVVSSKPGGSARAEAPVNPLDVSAQNPERDGFMTQQMGYMEIPVELNYALIDKKFGLNLIGGVSSLFLIDNSVALTSGNLTTEMGAANNINTLNFSANFGLGVNYKFSNNIQLNLEPVFKYQLNTFSETDGTFNPYVLGIYSGFNFRF